MTRPTLTEHTSIDDFASFYWLKEELVAFCRAQGLSTLGSKQDLSARIRQFLETGMALAPPSVNERIRILRIQLEKSVAYKGERATLFEMRKIYSGYFRGIPGFKSYRIRLVTAASLVEVDSILTEMHYL